MCSQSPVKLELVTLLHVSFSHYCNPLSHVLQSIISRYCNPLSHIIGIHYLALLQSIISHYWNPLSCVIAIHYLAFLQSIISHYCNPLSRVIAIRYLNSVVRRGQFQYVIISKLEIITGLNMFGSSKDIKIQLMTRVLLTLNASGINITLYII